MSEQKESSVLFSLKELMNLEEDRIRTEEDAKAHRAAQEESARVAAERAAHEAQEARLRSEEERRRLEEQRSREEAARLEAIRQGEVERARHEAEAQARQTAMAAQQQHEQKLAAIKGDEQKKKLRNLLIGLGVGAVVLVGGIGGFAYNQHVKSQEELRKQQVAAAEAEKKLTDMQRQLKEKEDAAKDLERQVATEKDERKKAELQAKLDAAKAEVQSQKTNIGSFKGNASTGSGAAAPAKPCGCNKLDPLCDC